MFFLKIILNIKIVLIFTKSDLGNMKIKYFGHASIYLESNGVSVVTDPWFSKDGAFLSTWFQFPDNTDLDLEKVRNVDYVVISHEHLDHLDPKFLKTINPKTKVLIPKYTDSYLFEKLKENIPNEVIVCNSMQKVPLNDKVSFCPVVQSVPIWDDCTLVFETPEGTIVDVNDMKITDKDLEWIKQNFKIDYLFMQYSGANWHPLVYDYSDEEKAKMAKHKILTKFRNVKQKFELSGAKYLIPSAGPPCFLDDKFFELNFSDQSIFPDQSVFYDYAKQEGFGDKTVILLPGDDFDPNQDCKLVSEKSLKHEAFTNKRSYLEKYRERRKDIIEKTLSKIEDPKVSLLEKAQEYFTPLVASSKYFREKISGCVLFEVSGEYPEKILVNFGKENEPVKKFEGEDHFYTFKVSSGILNLVLDKKLSWEQLLLSLRFRSTRNPDVFNEFLVVFLRFADPASYKQYELFEKRKDVSDTFILEHCDKQYRVQKYCPHAMGDLSKGVIEDNCIVCPNHGWTFSLENGECLNNKASITVQEIQKEKKLA